MAVDEPRPTLGILGGVFDPPHVGHLALARAAMARLGLERLLVLVNADPGHKRATTPAGVRLELAHLAFDELAGVEVELDPHPRTVDMLEQRRPRDAVFVVGADELLDYATWKEPARVLELVRLAVAMRPGVPDEQLREARARVPAPDRILYFELEPVPVSSSEIRARVAAGEPIDELVPGPVAEAIAGLRLYRKAE
jgi:nicotinate-nucleotide adenylyltransferase